MALVLQFTTAGLAECIAAKDKGLKAQITHMAFGDVAFAPSKSTKALAGEKERVEINERMKGYEINDYQDAGQSLKMAGIFNGNLEYSIRSIGIFLSTGTLLGVYSAPGILIGYRTPAVRVVQWFTLNIDALPTNSVTVVVGVENLNLILDAEFAEGCAAFMRQGCEIVKNCHWNMQLSERIRKLEQ